MAPQLSDYPEGGATGIEPSLASFPRPYQAKSPMTRLTPWWRPDVFNRRLPLLRARARITTEIRAYFLARDFDEVETPILQVSPGNETHIASFATNLVRDDGGAQPMHLHTSPEFACKTLLAAGLPQVFTLARVFRNRERGRLHHPEFTMLEWYRTEATLDTLMADCTAILRLAADEAGTTTLRHRGRAADLTGTFPVVTVSEAFRLHAGIDLDAMLPDTDGGLVRLADAARGLGLRVADDDTWSDLFSKIVSAAVEPKLGLHRPTFLTRYPASEAALACLCPDDPRFAERFELYACGIELANAFSELRDPVEQRRRFDHAEAERLRIYGETYLVDEAFLAALAVMPPACGIALGLDRLVMLATGADSIEDVLWVPVADLAS